MTIASKIAPSADLLTGMLDRLGRTVVGPDETATLAHGRALRNMVFLCLACPDQPGCAALQARNRHLDRPPSYCRNAQTLKALPNT